MVANAKLLALAALFFAGVHAQSGTATGSAAVPTSTSQIPPCVLTCIETGLQSSNGACTSITDPCVCTNTAFQKAAAACLAKNCSAADQQAALQLQQAFCSGASGSSGAASSTATGTASSGSSAASSSAATPTGSSTGSGTTPASGSSTTSGAASSATSSTTKKNAATANVALFGQGGLIALGISVAGAVAGGMML